MKNLLKNSFLAMALAIVSLPVVLGQVSIPDEATSSDVSVSDGIDVLIKYSMTGWMGDGKSGKKYIQLQQQFETSGSRRTRIAKITYKIGLEGWAGASWLYKAGNWETGADLGALGFKRVRFYARGERGGEVVKFNAGGLADSLEVSTGDVELEKDWKPYEIKLDDENLSNVISLFSWFATEDSNSNGLTFFIKDVRYE